MGELFAHDFISNQEMKRVELNEKELEKYLVKDGDLLFARRSLVLEGSGKCSIIISPSEATTFESSMIRARLNKNKANCKFYYYLFCSPLGRGLIAAIASQTAVSGIRGSDLVEIKLPFPPLPVQNKIASILSAYDRLIENNTRRIKILESMAQTLCQEWFVKFRFPGHKQVKMVESELGLIPEGWEVKELGDLYKTSSGGTPSRKVDEYYEDGGMNWVKTRELKDNFIFDTEEKITQLGLKKSSAKLFPQNTVLIAMYGATIGKLAILANPSTTNQACCAILSQTDLFGYSYAFSYLLDNREKIFSLGMGAAQQNISQQVIKKFQILKPTNEIMKAFNEVANPILETIKVLQQKNDNLRKTRDLLLPKLISGQIDVENLDIDTGKIAA